jgi:hypothetical protein
MSRNWAVAVAATGLLGAAACGSPEIASGDDPSITRADLLPDASELPPGAQVGRLEGDDQMILNLNIHAPSDGIGLDMNPAFDPAQCAGESMYADQARAGLIKNGSASAARLESGGGYIMLVSETTTDVSRVVAAHTGPCSSYSVTSTSFDGTSQHTIRTERLDLPPALVAEDAAILYEVSDPDNPEWSDTEVLLGYATVGKYTVVVISYEGRQSQSEFDDVFTRVVGKVRRLG